MKYRQLIQLSHLSMEDNPMLVAVTWPSDLFGLGANWMFGKLENDTLDAFDPAIAYQRYGFLKYGLSIIGMVLSAWYLGSVSWYLVPISIVVFYMIEIHFLFLFPILLDRKKKPIWTSIKQTYQMGFFKVLFVVLPIGFFMVFGLFRKQDPLYNWHVGCLAIIIWYQYEVRDRL